MTLPQHFHAGGFHQVPGPVADPAAACERRVRRVFHLVIVMALGGMCGSDTVLIIDGPFDGIVFYALPPDVTATARHTNAAYGFVSNVDALAGDREADASPLFRCVQALIPHGGVSEYRWIRDAIEEFMYCGGADFREVLDAMRSCRLT